MFTTIIFDLADVYICGILGLENKLAKKLNINPVIISKWLHNRDLKKLFIGKISEKEYWKRFLERYKIQMDISELKKVVLFRNRRCKRNNNKIKKRIQNRAFV
jgi:hypothetical protein